MKVRIMDAPEQPSVSLFKVVKLVNETANQLLTPLVLFRERLIYGRELSAEERAEERRKESERWERNRQNFEFREYGRVLSPVERKEAIRNEDKKRQIDLEHAKHFKQAGEALDQELKQLRSEAEKPSKDPPVFYDAFRNISWSMGDVPQRLDGLALSQLAEMSPADQVQACIEYLFPFAPGEPYPFPADQINGRQAVMIQVYRDRVISWKANMPPFSSEIQNWVQDSRKRIVFGLQHKSSLSLSETIGRYQIRPEQHQNVTYEKNMAQMRAQGESNIARLALLYDLLVNPAPGFCFTSTVPAGATLSTDQDEQDTFPFNLTRLDKLSHRNIVLFIWETRPTRKQLSKKFPDIVLNKQAWKSLRGTINNRLIDCEIVCRGNDHHYELVKTAHPE
jgi:hypothetical protein